MDVPRLWPGETVICIAGGPSLTPEDVVACRGRRVIAVNDAYRLAPWADVLYAADAQWWRWHNGVPGFRGLKYSIDVSNKRSKRWIYKDVQLLKMTGETGLETQPSGVRTGRNSGYQAINLALHLAGGPRILLLGYDMQIREASKHHWFGSHPNLVRPPLSEFIRHFHSLAAPLRALGIEVINCSRDTALSCFPRLALQDALSL